MFEKIFKKKYKKEQYIKFIPMILLNEYIYIANEEENNEYVNLLNKINLTEPRYCDYYSD